MNVEEWIRKHKVTTVILVLACFVVLFALTRPEERTVVTETKVIERIREVDSQEVKELKEAIALYEKILDVDNEFANVSSENMIICSDAITATIKGDIDKMTNLTSRISKNIDKVEELTKQRTDLYSAIK